MGLTPRGAAFSLLMQQQKSGSYVDLLLENSEIMRAFDVRDRAFIVSLVYGVTERRITLDYNLSLYLQKPLKKAAAGSSRSASSRRLADLLCR